MKNTVVYETLVDVFLGPKNFNLTYRDYSDGTNLLFIELLSEDNQKVFSVVNYIPNTTPESLIKTLKEESGIKCDETLEEFYYEILQRIYKGLDIYLNSTIKRSDYFQHYYENGVFKNLIDFDN